MKFKDWWGKTHIKPKNKTVSWRPSAYGLIIKNKRVLLAKAHMHGLWELPGGGVELNERIFEALYREVYEETGYQITVENRRPIYMEDNYFYAPDIDEYSHTIPLIFLATPKRNNTAKPMHTSEIDEVKWFTIHNLPKPLNSIATNAIRQYKKIKKINV